jgi:hypothetical protein
LFISSVLIAALCGPWIDKLKKSVAEHGSGRTRVSCTRFGELNTMFIHRLAGSKCSEVDGHVTKSMRQLLVSCSRMFNCRSLARRFAEGGDVMFIERCGRGVVVGEETEHDLVAGFDCGSASCLLKDGADPWDSFGVVSWQLTRSCLCPEYHTLTFTHINRLHWLWSSPWRRGAPA